MDGSEKPENKRSPYDKETLRRNIDALYETTLRNHRIQRQLLIDEQSRCVSRIEENDVLFGRGKIYQNHKGNIRMRQIVSKHKKKYKSLKRTEKWGMVEAVYQEITDGGARFLKKSVGSDTWVLVSKEIALEKVSHTFRSKHVGDANRKAPPSDAKASNRVNRMPPSSSRIADAWNSISATTRATAPSHFGVASIQQPLLGIQVPLPTNPHDIPIVPSANLHQSSISYQTMIAQQEQQLRDALLIKQIEDVRNFNAARTLLLQNALLPQYNVFNPYAQTTESFPPADNTEKDSTADNDGHKKRAAKD